MVQLIRPAQCRLPAASTYRVALQASIYLARYPTPICAHLPSCHFAWLPCAKRRIATAGHDRAGNRNARNKPTQIRGSHVRGVAQGNNDAPMLSVDPQMLQMREVFSCGLAEGVPDLAQGDVPAQFR
jgi:hypothetical protein